MTSEQIAAVVEEIRQRVRARYEKQVDGLPDFVLPSLTPVGQARDAAEGKVAAIGTVNPRPPGLVNNVVQAVKKAVARALHWHVREQVEFNRAVVAFMDRALASMDEQNRQMLLLGRLVRQHNEVFGDFREWRSSEIEWRRGWEEKAAKTEIQLLRTAAELQSAFLHRTTLMESNFREHVQAQHADYLSALERATLEIQKKLWDDLAKVRNEFEKLIHTELRLIRQRRAVDAPPAQPGVMPSEPQELDYARFAERFRGPERYVSANQRFYLPYFEGRRAVLDLGCGRGEFLALMREHGVGARGVDADADSVGTCRQKGLQVEQGDLFQYLAGLADESLDGIFSAQVVEHLPAARIPELIGLAARKLERGGVLAVETPNPECLAIFATNFYIDPTHVRPVPSALLHFYMQESGFGGIEVHQLAPAAEVFPEIASLAQVEGLADFQKRFFGGLDYAILGRKL